MTPVELLLSKLSGVRASGDGWSSRCPAHDDRRASLSVSEGDDGRVLLRCHAGCDLSAILAALRLKKSDLFTSTNRNGNGRASTNGTNGKPHRSKPFPTANAAVASLERQHGKRAAIWKYHDAAGNPIGLVVRWDKPDGKTIRPVSIRSDGWHIGAMPDPRPLYGLPDLATANRVIVTEGEKAADAARELGFTVTTSAGGSQAANKTDWQPLAGKQVLILPDNDRAGRAYADSVAGILAKLNPPATVRIVELPDLAEGEDVADWVSSGGTREQLEALAAATAPLSGDQDAGEAEPPEDLEYRPFPTDALPEPIRSFVASGAKAIGCDMSYLALPLLTALGAAVGNARRLRLKHGWYVPAILWSAIIGESGTAKTPAFKLAMQPVRERQRKSLERHAEEMKQYEAELARWEKDRAAWKRSKEAGEEPPAKPDAPHAERYIVSDTTVEALAPILMANPRGLLLARDELAGWLGSFDRYASRAGADSASWLSMHNAESIVIDRKTGLPRTIHVPQAAVCVTGGIQPGILERALGTEHRESGLAARLLLCCPPRKPKLWTEADIDPRAEAGLAALFDRLYDLQPTVSDDGEARPALVRLDADAKSTWVNYYNAHAVEQVDLSGDLSAAWAKLEEYPARLALIVHFTRWAANDPALQSADRLDLASINAGITLAQWFKNEARRVYAMLGESDTDRDLRRLAEWIERRGGTATAREVRQGCRWLKEPGAAESVLEELVKSGRGTWAQSPAGQRGQPTRAFVLSTPSTVYGNSESPEEYSNTVDVDNVGTPKVQLTDQAELFPFGANNPDDPDGERLFNNPVSNLPD